MPLKAISLSRSLYRLHQIPAISGFVYSTSNLIYNAVDELYVEGTANDKNKKFYNTYSKCFVYVFVFSAVIACQQSLYGRLSRSD